MSNPSADVFDAILTSPVEKLDTEIKAWFDPHAPEGVAKIAKACIALYNNNGGVLAIGISADGQTDAANVPADVRNTFSSDCIQGIVAKYASRPFAVEIAYRQRDGITLVLVSVPPGVISPIACKSELASGGKVLLRNHAVYVRTINANNTVSSSEAKCADWDDVVRRCFDNREADIGAFFRRHLSATNLRALIEALPVGGHANQSPTAIERSLLLLDDGYARMRTRAQERESVDVTLLGTRECAVVISGDVPKLNLDRSLLFRLNASAPRLTGWPPWINIPGIGNNPNSPYVDDDGFEAFIDFDSGRRSVDFWRIAPRGEFYHSCVLEDDSVPDSGELHRSEVLEPVLVIRRITELVAIAAAFAIQMGCERDTTSLAVTMRWRNLRGRRLSTWANPSRSFRGAARAVQSDVTSSSLVPLSTPRQALSSYVSELASPVFAVFGGEQFGQGAYDDLVRETLDPDP